MTSSKNFSATTCAVGLVALAAFLGTAGCQGGKKVPVGEVSGKVTFEGKPVAAGLVSFMNSQAGAGDEANLNPDGTYAIKLPLPVGEYKVIILPPIVYQRVDPRGPEVGDFAVTKEIPQRYRAIGTTDLKATVKEGKNEINLEMKR